MKINYEQIRDIIYIALDKVNESLPPDQKIVKALTTRLLGDQGVLDSLSLITLIVAIEQRINDDYGVIITLAQEQLYAHKISPFATVQSLIDYIMTLLNNSSHAHS